MSRGFVSLYEAVDPWEPPVRINIIKDYDILRCPLRKKRNEEITKADWQFTTADARIKLKHLYPSI